MSTDPHDNPNGPGDARPTAAQIIEREHAADRLKGKNVLITGATSGIGLETAKQLLKTGCHLFLPVRDLATAGGIVADLHTAAADGGKIDLLSMDLSDLSSVRNCVEELKTKTKILNILINNAGVMATPEGRTKDGFETQFGTNHVGHFLLFQLLKPLLLAGSTPEFHSRVVVLSSSAHNISPVLFDDYDLKKVGYEKWKSYGQSKTANLWFALEIERRFGSRGIHAWAVHPGGIMTNLQRHMPEEEQKTRLAPMQKHFKTIEQGAATTIWAATSAELEGKGGKYLEDCRIGKPRGPSDSGLTGHAKWAYDGEGAKRLYDETLSMLNMTEEE